MFLHAAISSDNSKAFFNQNGAVFFVRTADDKLTWATSDPACCYGDYDLTLSSGQTTSEATSYLYDANLNAESYLVLTDRESSNISYVYGTQLSADGTLLFQPSTNEIDVYDGRLGMLVSRIPLPFALSQNYDALVADGKDNILIAITGTTGTGIAVVDLDSVPEPAPLPYVSSIVGANVQGLMNENESTPHPRSTTPSHRVPKFKVPHATNGISPSKAALSRKRAK